MASLLSWGCLIVHVFAALALYQYRPTPTPSWVWSSYCILPLLPVFSCFLAVTRPFYPDTLFRVLFTFGDRVTSSLGWFEIYCVDNDDLKVLILQHCLVWIVCQQVHYHLFRHYALAAQAHSLAHHGPFRPYSWTAHA